MNHLSSTFLNEATGICWLSALRGILAGVPGWRNGRRYGLKIRCPQGRAGSTPALGTNYFNNLRVTHCLDRNLHNGVVE